MVVATPTTIRVVTNATAPFRRTLPVLPIRPAATPSQDRVVSVDGLAAARK
jgi:hypothetical protein